MSSPCYALIPPAATKRGAWAVEVLKQSTKLRIPKLRKDTFVESCRVAPDEDSLKEVFLEAICGSPYIPEHLRQELADNVFSGNWRAVAERVGALQQQQQQQQQQPPEEPEVTAVTTEEALFVDFKYMAICIFKKSRKIQKLSLQRKRMIGQAVLSCQDRESLVELLFLSLETAETLNYEARVLIANDVLEGQFHRLLLSDRFDCDEVPRENSDGNHIHVEEPEDCCICLGPFHRPVILPECKHEFCRECVRDWSTQFGDPFPCPICRVPNHLCEESDEEIYSEYKVLV